MVLLDNALDKVVETCEVAGGDEHFGERAILVSLGKVRRNNPPRRGLGNVSAGMQASVAIDGNTPDGIRLLT